MSSKKRNDGKGRVEREERPSIDYVGRGMKGNVGCSKRVDEQEQKHDECKKEACGSMR